MLANAARVAVCVCVGGQNEYVWQAWAMLESRCGKIAQARKLFDAALVANRKHAAAWHGWGHMEKRQGNLLKAKDIWMKVRSAPFRKSLLARILQGQGLPTEAERRQLAGCSDRDSRTFIFWVASRGIWSFVMRAGSTAEPVRTIECESGEMCKWKACATLMRLRRVWLLAAGHQGDEGVPKPSLVPVHCHTGGRDGLCGRGAAVVPGRHICAPGQEEPRPVARLGSHGG